LVGNAKKMKTKTKSLQNECFVTLALRNVVLNEILLNIFYYLMSINYMRAFIKANYQ
jgi:hypothetical protein